jgi:hypothetical protein
MEFIIRHNFRNITFGNKKYYVSSFFHNLRDELIKQYPEHTFTIKLDNDYEKFGGGGIFSTMSFSIINPENRNYILVSFFDNWKYHFMKHMGWEPSKMKQFFYPGGFSYLEYFNFKQISKNNLDIELPNNFEKIYQPFFYGPYFDCCYNEIENIYDSRKTIELKDNLIFRGWMWDFRKKMVENLNQSDILVFDKNQNNQSLDYYDYLLELSKNKAALSLPGGTEICNRDIECFGIGVPVVRPALSVVYPEPLIPNYHYISTYQTCDYLDVNSNPKYLSYDDFKKNLIYTWNTVKNNDEYMRFISNNARNWFVKNCTLTNNLKYVLNKINLNLIYE